MNVYECDGTYFMGLKMKCSIHWGETKLNRTFYFSPYKISVLSPYILS